MMRPSQVASLVVAGVVIAGIGAWLAARGSSRGAADAPARVLQLTPQQLNAVTRLRIYKGDGSHATLQHAGTGWLVTERGYPVDTGQLRKLLLDLANLRVEEQKTADPMLYSKLGVEDPASAPAASTGLDIDLDGKTLRLIVGKTSGTGSVYVRMAGQAQSLLASPQLAPDADPRHWLDRTLLDISPDQITDVSVAPAAGPEYTIKRSAADAASAFTVSPIPKGRQLGDATAPAAQAAALAALRLDDVRKAGTQPATAHATFHSRDGLSLALAGFQDGERRYINVAATATAAAAQSRAQELNARLAGWQFEIPGYRFDTLFRPLEQLLKPKQPASSGPVAKRGALPFGPAGKATPLQSH